MIRPNKQMESLVFHRYYFITAILTDKISEDEGVSIFTKIFEKRKDLCSIEEMKKCGLKQFSYPIKKEKEGIYLTFIIKVLEDDNLKQTLNEITRIIKGEKTILRFIMCRHTIEDNLPDSMSSLKAYYFNSSETIKK